MDSDFEEKCRDISKKRKERKASVTEYLPPFLQTPQYASKSKFCYYAEQAGLKL